MNKKQKLLGTLIITSAAIFSVAITTRGIANSDVFNRADADFNYSITLNSSNRITSNVSTATSFTRYTQLNNQVTFEYKNCNASNGYHAVISTTGYIKNTKAISGVTSITPTFTVENGDLRVRASFDNENWGEYAVLKSGHAFNFNAGSYPSYIELSASGSNVSLTSISYAYTCSETEKVEKYIKVTSNLDDYAGQYLIVNESNNVAYKNITSSPNSFNVTIQNNEILKSTETEQNYVTVSKASGSEWYFVALDSKYLDWPTGGGTIGHYGTNYSQSISISNGIATIGNGNYYIKYSNSSFVFASGTSGVNVSLYKANFGGSESAEVPSYACSISYTDTKASKYAIGDIFDSFVDGKGLNVSVNNSNGATTKLTKTQYSYEIKNGNTVVPSNSAFETAGTYTVNISYQDYFKCSYQITVNETAQSDDYTLVTDAGDLSIGQSVVITTKPSSNYSYALSTTQNEKNRGTVEVEFTNDILNVVDGVCEFELKEGTGANTFSFYDAENDGYIYSASSSANQLKTQDSNNANSSYAISINGSGEATISSVGTNTRNTIMFNYNNANPIFSCYASNATQELVSIYAKNGSVTPKVQVTSVTLNKSSVTLDVDQQEQLSATVLPENASNKSLTWESSDSTVASVDSNGNVTALKPGSTTITATAKDGSGKWGSCSVTVNNIAVSSVSLDKTTASLTVNGTTTLTPTVLPANASNKSVTWSSDNTSVATVNNGVVTAKAAGTAIITVTTVDGSKTASCTVTVTSGGGQQSGDEYQVVFVKNNSDSGTEVTTLTSLEEQILSGSEYIESLAGSSKAYPGTKGLKLGSNKSSGFVSLSLADTIATQNATSVTYTIEDYGNDSAASTLSINDIDVQTKSDAGTYTYTCESNTQISTISFSSDARIYIADFTINCVPATPVNPTGIQIPSTASVGVGKTTSLDVTYLPAGCNTNKGVTWTSSNTSIATVNSSTGVITGVSAGSVTITAKSTFNTSFTSSCTLTVTEEAKDKWTILVYLCGSDLESGWDDDANRYTDDTYYASLDLNEIKSVSGQPNDVNIVFEAGGSSRWSPTYNSLINANKLNRFHLKNKNYVLDEQITNASMGKASTLQSFINWGMETYPAEKTALIFWNHGGGMRGVCYDENYDYDRLKNSEVKQALSNSLGSNKLEFIGYDACLMAVQDVAEFNSKYANYMVCSEESESGYGWDYDTWIDDVYANKSTETILTSIVDGFISDTNSLYKQNKWGDSDQTLSWLDLSKMSAYKTAFESFASSLSSKLSTLGTSKNTFKKWVVGNVKHYADTDYNFFHCFDAYDFISKIRNSTYNPSNDLCYAAQQAFNDLVGHNNKGSGAGNSYGLALIYGCDGSYDNSLDTDYSTSETNFTNWRSFVSAYGYI